MTLTSYHNTLLFGTHRQNVMVGMGGTAPPPPVPKTGILLLYYIPINCSSYPFLNQDKYIIT